MGEAGRRRIADAVKDAHRHRQRPVQCQPAGGVSGAGRSRKFRLRRPGHPIKAEAAPEGFTFPNAAAALPYGPLEPAYGRRNLSADETGVSLMQAHDECGNGPIAVDFGRRDCIAAIMPARGADLALAAEFAAVTNKTAGKAKESPQEGARRTGAKRG